MQSTASSARQRSKPMWRVRCLTGTYRIAPPFRLLAIALDQARAAVPRPCAPILYSQRSTIKSPHTIIVH